MTTQEITAYELRIESFERQIADYREHVKTLNDEITQLRNKLALEVGDTVRLKCDLDRTENRMAIASIDTKTGIATCVRRALPNNSIETIELNIDVLKRM